MRSLTRSRRFVSNIRTHHGDYPSVLNTEYNGEMDFDDPMMRHMKYNRDIRMLSKGEQRLRRDQVEVLEQRWEKQIKGRIRAAEITERVKALREERMAKIKEGMLIGDEIPETASKVTITHIGTLDGFDEPVAPVDLTRSAARKYEEELGMSLCLTALSEDASHAICRLRHLMSYLARTARQEIALETSQMQRNSDRESPIIEYPIRANIQSKNLIYKCYEICERLYDNNRVRIVARNCTNCIDSAELLLHICRVLDAVATGDDCVNPIDKKDSFVSFSMGAPVFSNLTCSCVLIPLGDGKPSQLISHDTMMAMARSVQQSRDEMFERQVTEEGGVSGRTTLEESRRRMFYGAQEDFLSSKARDETIEARLDPWLLPPSNADIRNMEHDAEMRLAGHQQSLIPTADADYTTGEHVFIHPDKLREGFVGSEDDFEIELTPGPDGKTRVASAVSRKLSGKHPM
eukprot:TRINITY_DN27468_c0_g1_i1.p1 TRINITY_DN27468_c0_g1~~TRINITY_DN27468_c0_g1_i1.p1  ORF type:complete len:461 (+),score=70.60 TRINITY_DN27468_c0_g1_i1:40-1422(+)